MERFFITEEFTDGTSETRFMSQTEAFQACTKALTEAVIERRKTGTTRLSKTFWGVEWEPGNIQIIESHDLSK